MPTHSQPDSAAFDTDARWMREALCLAEDAIGMAAPNPTVGCVLVHKGKAVGRGAHIYDNRDHAEVVALRQAGDRATGATAYVTLEPCSHIGRTGPCAEALIRARVARVVVATGDPNPLVQGRGIALLRQAGLEVTLGVAQEHARAINDGFARHIRTGLPFVTLKAGLSLDGRIAPAPRPPRQDGLGSTTYLTGTHSLLAVQRLRHAADALLTGIGTVLADNPLLTDRSNLPRRRPLMRVVLDSDLRLAVDSRLVASARGNPEAPAAMDDRQVVPSQLLVLTRDATGPKAEALRGAGVIVEPLATTPDGRLDPAAALQLLGERGVLNLLVEAGSSLNRSLLQAELVDKLTFFYAPLLLGDRGVPLVAGPGSLHPEFHRTVMGRSGDDICFEAHLRDPWP